MGLTEEAKKKRNELTDQIVTFKPGDNVDYVFISYKSDDWETVIGDIVKTLVTRCGVRVFFDKSFAEDNDSWVDNMKSAIKTGRCKAVLSFISKGYMESYACLMELLTARSKVAENTHREKKLPIIPILLNGGKVSEYRSDSTEKINVSEWDAYEAIVDNAFFNEPWIKGKVKDAIEVLRDEKSKATIEEMSLAMESILNDGTYSRYFDGTDHFYNELKKALESESKTIFDNSLIKTPDCKKTKTEETVPAESPLESTVEEKPRKSKKPKETKSQAASSDIEVDLNGITSKDSSVTIGMVRNYMSNAVNARKFREVRESMPHGGKAAMDYAMAAILYGCNSIVDDSPKYQKNYYLFDIADPSKAKEDGKLGATWTWSSNCRKLLKMDGSGQIDKEIDRKFKEMEESMTLGMLQKCFETHAEKSYITTKNDLVILALQKISDAVSHG